MSDNLKEKTGLKGVNGLFFMKMIWIMCHGLHRQQISTQLNIYGILDQRFYRHQNPKWGNIFWKSGSAPPVEFRGLQDQCQGTSKLFWWHMVAQHLTKTFYVRFFYPDVAEAARSGTGQCEGPIGENPKIKWEHRGKKWTAINAIYWCHLFDLVSQLTANKGTILLHRNFCSGRGNLHKTEWGGSLLAFLDSTFWPPITGLTNSKQLCHRSMVWIYNVHQKLSSTWKKWYSSIQIIESDVKYYVVKTCMIGPKCNLLSPCYSAVTTYVWHSRG